jgi:glycosyltransferase involved in cell wall biosynthesis
MQPAVGKMISFIVPTYNSEKTLGKCLESIMSQRCAKEVIVVDGGSSDGTVKIATKHNVKLLADAGGKISTARNAGLKAASGEYIAFVDSDVVLPSDWCKKCLLFLKKDAKIAGVGGPGISPDKSIVSESLNSLLYGKSPEEQKVVDSIATMDAMYSMDAIQDQLFDEGLETGEDPEFNMRLLKKGYNLFFSKKLWVFHYHPIGIVGMMKKWYNYGKNYPDMCSRHEEFRNREYYLRLMYMPLLIAFAALSLWNVNFALLALAQVLLVYLAYVKKGIEIGVGARTPVFSGIHALKQLAQLAGNLAGVRKLL